MIGAGSWRRLWLFAAWVVSAAAVAIAAGGFVAIVADFLGAPAAAASVAFDVVAAIVFAAAVALPWLIRGRTGGGDRV